MSPRERQRREERIAALSAKRDLSPGEHAELDWLIRWRDLLWRRLPRQIAAQRERLANLESYANEIGLGPC